MHIRKIPLYRRARHRVPRHIRILLAIVALVAPMLASGVSEHAPWAQEFIVTAYYSPLPGQCCYVRGGYRADKVLNGEGVRGADGTDVRFGMAAAPASYPFGTVVVLPGIGSFGVHDRGGAIQELEGGVHRLDIWVGYGEEGLARALAFGVRRIQGTVYPVEGVQPKERFAVEAIPASVEGLKPFLVTGGDLLAVSAQAGDRGLSVKMVQQALKDLGFFRGGVTGLYGEATERALQAFHDAFRSSEPADHLTARSAAMLMAARKRISVVPPVRTWVERGAPQSTVRAAQRTLRFFGFYQGRTDGQYDDALSAAILRFQQVKGLVGTAEDPGAGRIGPITRKELTAAWNRRLTTAIADRLLMLHEVETILDRRGETLDRFLAEGDGGSQVTLLQRLLAERGHFPAEKINGHFGELTKAGVLQYQLAQNLITDERSAGAGSVGPQTLLALRSEERRELYLLVRGEGWKAI